MTSLACDGCGAQNRAAARFCDSCGRPVGAAPAAEPARPRPQAGESPRPQAGESPRPQAGESPRPQAGESPRPQLEEELKYVTVLFTDIVNSTAMVSDRSPEEARQRFTPALRAMSEAVSAFGGTVNQLLGDGVMAIFGAPVSHEDHAVRACAAALRMHAAASQLLPPTALRVGLASGPMLLTPAGAAEAGAYLTFGATIHLASRLQGLATPGSTLCSAETMQLAGTSVAGVSLGSQAIRGVVGDREVFQVAAIRRNGLRTGGRIDPANSPYVGREAEMQRLLDLARSMPEGPPTAIAVVGEAGAGKSRLVRELMNNLAPLQWRLVQAEALSYGRNFPFHLVTALLRSCLNLQEDEDHARAVTAVHEQLDALGDFAQVSRAAILSLLNLPLHGVGAEWSQLDPVRRRNALRDGVAGLLQALASRNTLAVILEDLHWADDESMQLLDSAAAKAGRLLLLSTYRPGPAIAWDRLAPTVIELAAIDAGGMEQLLRRSYPGAFDAAARQELVERAGGNPFFLQEMVRTALDTPLHERARTLASGGVPPTIQAVLSARVDALPQAERQVLRAASAFGNRFPLTGLQALFPDRTISDFQAQLSRLREAGMLRPEPSSDRDEGFGHALTREVVYGGLTRDAKRRMHAAIVTAICDTNPERIGDQAETLVHHAVIGEVWDAVVVHARVAGHRAASRSAYITSARFFNQAIDAYDHLPLSNDGLKDRIDLRFDLRNALFPTADISKTLVCSREALRLARQLGDPGRLGWATAFHARDLTLFGRPTEALNLARQASIASDDDELHVMTDAYTALAAYSHGNYRESATLMRGLVTHIAATDPDRRYRMPAPAIIFLQGWHAWALARLGEWSDAEAASHDMLVRAEAQGQPLGLTVAHLSRGFVLAHARRLPEAAAALRLSLEMCEAWNFFAWFTNIASCLGHVLASMGQTSEGIALLTRAAERTKGSGILVSHATELAWLAEAHQRAGDHAQALRLAHDALATARQHEERGNEALAQATLGALLLHAGDEAAAAAYRTALRLARSCEMAPLVQSVSAALARLGVPVQCDHR